MSEASTSKREMRAEAVRRLKQLKELDKYTDASIMGAIFGFSTTDEWLQFTQDVAIDAFIDILGEDTCQNVHEPPRNTTFWPAPHFQCSVCGEKHVSLDYVYYCPKCGAKVEA